MSKKRGLSLEEKREKILEVFHETKDVFTLKDVEKLASKKGVVLQSVKEVLQSLVDDDLVHQDKIGIGNFFWSFPGEQGARLAHERSRLEGQLASLQAQRTELEAQAREQLAAKQDSERRQALMAEVRQAEALSRQLQQQVQAYAENDPETLELMARAAEEAKAAANRYMDNIWSIQSWAKKTFGGAGDPGMLDAFFENAGLTDALDSVE